MEDYHRKLIQLIKLDRLIEYRIFLIMERFVICCGQTLEMRVEMDLVHHQEVQDIVGERTLRTSSIIEII